MGSEMCIRDSKDSGAGADSLETLKTDKDGFMEAKDEEIPFD